MVTMAKRYSHYFVDDLRDAMEQTSVPVAKNTAQNTAPPTVRSCQKVSLVGRRRMLQLTDKWHVLAGSGSKWQTV